MELIGGDVKQISIDHPELGSRLLTPQSGEDFTIIKGGYQNADTETNVSATGKRIYQKNWIPWSVSGKIVLESGDHDYLQDMATNPKEAVIGFLYMNGQIRVGKGSVVGGIDGETQTHTMTVKFSGSGKLELI
jgi:hypothetical protein